MTKRSPYLIAIFMCISLSFAGFAEVGLTKLTCEMLPNPQGIEDPSPRLGWQIESTQRNVQQVAYHILVAGSLEKLNEKEADLWNSGKVKSTNSQHNTYQGKLLKSRTECYWKVKVWTNKGESEWSAPAHWSMGLLHYKDWQARWIGFDRPFEWDNDAFHSQLSARYFRKEFNIEKEIKSAKAYLIGLGLYELSANGEKVGDAVLAPSPSDYHQNIKYNIIDLKDHLKKGSNAIGIVLGNGRYYTMRQHYKGYKIKNFGFPKLLFQLEIEYTDGSSQFVRSDNSWKGTAAGPIRSNNEYDGEIYDALKEMPGWNNVGFDDSLWIVPEYVEQPDGNYESQLNPNMKILKELKPVKISRAASGKYILDMGQNMVGWLQIKVNGNAGDTVTMRFGEILKANGDLFTDNLRNAQAKAQYIMKGSKSEQWEPRFVYFGFRYVEISGWPGTPSVDHFVGKVVSDEMDENGTFECSNALVEQIYRNAWWGIIGNYKGMPVDCPQRNERQPWLGDRTIGCLGENYVFDNAALYKKWLDDIAYSQKNDGSISDVAPAFWRYYSDNMSWAGAFLTVADMLHRQTGDSRPIEKYYGAMRKWLKYMESRYLSDKYIMTKDSYGDWCMPPPTIAAGRGKSANVKHPSQLISTAYYYYFLKLIQKFAKLSGHENDIGEYEAQARKVYQAFNVTFYKTEQQAYGDNKLTENLLATAFGLVPDTEIEGVKQNIVNLIEVKNKGHLSTGVVGTSWLMRTLTDIGQSALAWKLVTNTTYPSWGYMIENGATTIWELWNGNTAAPKMNSYNHVMMLGDLPVWLYEDLLGISPSEEKVGFKEIVMEPQLIDGLRYARGSYQSPYGKIKSSWHKKGSTFRWDISIPPNSTACVSIPSSTLSKIKEGGKNIQKSEGLSVLAEEKGRVLLHLGSGDYQFESHLN